MNYYEEIKNRLEYNEAYKKIKDYSKNRNDLQTYYDVGRLLVEAQGGENRSKYGDQLIKEYSDKLTKELGKGYSRRNLYNMRAFYLKIYKDKNILQAMPAILSWSHITELLSIKSIDAFNYYIDIVNQEKISYRELRKRIKSNEYERLDKETKNKLIKKENLKPLDLIRNPIFIKNIYSEEVVKEKILEDLIMEQLPEFLKQLGSNITFVDRQYKLIMKGKNNLIDLLLFSLEFNSYIVVDLKIGNVKKQNFSQIKIYMEYIDKNIKKQEHNLTLGLIICKKDDGIYGSYYPDDRIKVIEFKIF